MKAEQAEDQPTRDPAAPGISSALDDAAPEGHPDGEGPQGAREQNLAEALDYLSRNLTMDNRATWVAAAVLGIPGIFLGKLDVVVLAVVIAAMTFYRMLAYRFYRRGDLTRGLLIVISGTWAVTIPIVAAIPETLPLMVITVIGPQIVAATFLPRRHARILIVVATLLVCGLGFLGFVQDGAGFDEYVPGWVFNGVIIGYLAAHILFFTVDVQEVNEVRLRGVRRLEQANARLEQVQADLRHSRRRLVTAADSERVRIERNIHDGAQQQLVAIAVQLNLAADLAEDGTSASAETLRRLHGHTMEAVEELRALAQGVYPAQLAEHGLVDALRGVARRSTTPLVVEADGSPDLDQGDEVALYFVCLEAIQNATKHGGAGTAVTVRVAADGHEVVVRVTDDGDGFDTAAVAGSRGLTNMADRIEALGGRLRLTSEPGEGTTVEAWLPRATVAAACPPPTPTEDQR